MRPRRGEVWWGEEPQRGRRPYLILTRNAVIGELSEVLVAVVTRTMRGIPTQVEIDKSDGMREPCAVNLDDMLMMPLGQLTERQCELSPERMAEVCAALDAATEC
jgi:mRNA interferase MazF